MLKDLKKIFTQSLIYGLGTMAPKLAGLVLIPLYTKHFPLKDFGMIGLLDSTAQIVIGIFGFALYQGFFRWYFDKAIEQRRKSLFFTLLLVHLIIAVTALILLWPLSDSISLMLFNHSGYAYVIKVMIIASLFQMVVIMPSTLMRVQEKAGLYTIGNLTQMGVMMLFTILFIVVFKQGVEAIYHAQILGISAYVILLIRYTVRNCEFRMEWHLLREIFRFSLPLFLSTIAVVLLNQADRYIIMHYGQLGDVGLYTLGFRLSNTLNVILVASITFAIQPLIFKKMDDPDNKRFYSKLMTYFVFVVMFFVMGMTFFAKEIVKLFSLRQEYYDAYRVIPLLSFAILFNLIKDVAMIGLQITKKTSIIAWIVVGVSATGILLNFILVPLFQNQGAAIARMLASVMFLVLVYYHSQRNYAIPYEVKKLAMMIIIGALLYLPVILVNESNLAIRIILKSSLIISYPFLLYLMGFFEAVEIKSIQGAWIKWRNPARLLSNFKDLLK